MQHPHIVDRQAEADWLIDALSGAHSAALIGLSNMGKSTLLRSLPALAQAHPRGTSLDCVYIDCNSMLEVSGQGFYELILRSVQEHLTTLDGDLAAEVAAQYQRIVEPESPFLVPLSFNRAMNAVIERPGRILVLLLDEFDEAFDTLDGRVFLNLRALKDKYPRSIAYVTATVRRLGALRLDEQVAEFVELSAAFTSFIKPLSRAGADLLARSLAHYGDAEEGLTPALRAFLWQQAGGHPGLLSAAVSLLFEAYADDLDQIEPAHLAEHLAQDISIRTECKRLWGQIGVEERDTLTELATRGTVQPGPAVRSLRDWGLITRADGQDRLFCELLNNYVQRQSPLLKGIPDGLWVDIDSGDVWVEGTAAPPLTELEFKLLVLLQERADKLTDKYQIVERVWGVDYLNEVDDARIEKLVSRLRAKIEPDPSTPRYLLTVRGRGYKLTTTP